MGPRLYSVEVDGNVPNANTRDVQTVLEIRKSCSFIDLDIEILTSST